MATAAGRQHVSKVVPLCSHWKQPSVGTLGTSLGGVVTGAAYVSVNNTLAGADASAEKSRLEGGPVTSCTVNGPPAPGGTMNTTRVWDHSNTSGSDAGNSSSKPALGSENSTLPVAAKLVPNSSTTAGPSSVLDGEKVVLPHTDGHKLAAAAAYWLNIAVLPRMGPEATADCCMVARVFMGGMTLLPSTAGGE